MNDPIKQKLAKIVIPVVIWIVILGTYLVYKGNFANAAALLLAILGIF